MWSWTQMNTGAPGPARARQSTPISQRRPPASWRCSERYGAPAPESAGAYAGDDPAGGPGVRTGSAKEVEIAVARAQSVPVGGRERGPRLAHVDDPCRGVDDRDRSRQRVHQRSHRVRGVRVDGRGASAGRRLGRIGTERSQVGDFLPVFDNECIPASAIAGPWREPRALPTKIPLCTGNLSISSPHRYTLHIHSIGTRRPVFGPTFVGNLTAHDERRMDAQHDRPSAAFPWRMTRRTAEDPVPGIRAEPALLAERPTASRPTDGAVSGTAGGAEGHACPQHSLRRTATDGRGDHGRSTASRMTAGRATRRRIPSSHGESVRDGRVNASGGTGGNGHRPRRPGDR